MENSSRVSLDLRGARQSVSRLDLMELPESVLLCLFPNGVVLSPQRPANSEQGEDVYYVDVRIPPSTATTTDSSHSLTPNA